MHLLITIYSKLWLLSHCLQRKDYQDKAKIQCQTWSLMEERIARGSLMRWITCMLQSQDTKDTQDTYCIARIHYIRYIAHGYYTVRIHRIHRIRFTYQLGYIGYIARGSRMCSPRLVCQVNLPRDIQSALGRIFLILSSSASSRQICHNITQLGYIGYILHSSYLSESIIPP